MHGVKRVRTTREAREAKKQKEAVKLKEYLGIVDEFFRLREAQDYSLGALELTSKLLGLNPEFYTVWNYRRTIFVEGLFRDAPSETIQNYLESDLHLTEAALKPFPKVYWIWNHRQWCLESMPEPKWKGEMELVDRMLGYDPRNFHGWDYRRYVLRRLSLSTTTPPTTPTSLSLDLKELDYTTRKIESNFSNFSAWHQRTKLLPRIWKEKGWGEEEVRREKDKEFELVKQAMYTDPNDQSVWIYHRWLIGKGKDEEVLRREIAIISDLFELEPDSKWCLQSLAHYKALLRQHLLSSVSVDGPSSEATATSTATPIRTPTLEGGATPEGGAIPEGGGETEATRLQREREEALTRLVEIDPMRADRYRDLFSRSDATTV